MPRPNDLPPYQPVAIAEFRYKISFANVVAQTNSSNISAPVVTCTEPVYAAISPVGTQLFYGDQNVDAGISHTVYCHYRTDAHSYNRIVQQIQIEAGRIQQIIYEVIRTTDWQGMKRFVRLDVRELTRTII